MSFDFKLSLCFMLVVKIIIIHDTYLCFFGTFSFWKKYNISQPVVLLFLALSSYPVSIFPISISYFVNILYCDFFSSPYSPYRILKRNENHSHAVSLTTYVFVTTIVVQNFRNSYAIDKTKHTMTRW